jgi:UDP-N-acetylmuramoylalanine--D-glutamate ligase
MRFSELENVRVAILGTGREGRAVWRQIRKRYPGKPLSLFSEADIDEDFKALINPDVDECHTGPFDISELKHFDVLVRSAGISPYRKELRQLQSMGLRFTSATNLWFAENPNAKTICISGTLGKSTTAALTTHLLRQAGVKVSLAGNIGRPMLDCENDEIDWWVIELSSYQISDLSAQPDIAMLLNLSEEHIDWHQGVENYQADKLKLARLSHGQFIANRADEVLTRHLQDIPGITWFNGLGEWQAQRNFVFRESSECDEQNDTQQDISDGLVEIVKAPACLPGEHNMQNLAAALTVIDLLGLKIAHIEKALSSFTGLPHRLELLGENAGVRYVNDSISTTPLSISAALQTLGSKGLVLLLGGLDRGLDWDQFSINLLKQAPYAIITLPDSGPKIANFLRDKGVRPEGGVHSVVDLTEAVDLAKQLVPLNGCILLSPGAPSFPHFRDFEERGEQFRKLAGF